MGGSKNTNFQSPKKSRPYFGQPQLGVQQSVFIIPVFARLVSSDRISKKCKGGHGLTRNITIPRGIV